MSDAKTKRATTERQAERLRAYFDEHPGGVTRGQAADAIGVPEASLSRLMAWLRHHATEINHMATCLTIGGVFIYGWADTLYDHQREHFKRRKAEKRSLLISIEMLEESVVEHPESEELRDQLLTARHRLETVENEMAKVGARMKLLRHEADRR